MSFNASSNLPTPESDNDSIDEDQIADPEIPGEVPAPGTDDEVPGTLPPNPGEEPVIR